MAIIIDPVARDWALNRWVLPECLHVPIAALDESAITDHIGVILERFGRGTTARALLVDVEPQALLDPRLPIWQVEGSEMLHRRLQVWVDVAYSAYRTAYRRALPHDVLGERVLSHAMNRRAAALKGYRYVRLVPTARGTNSSSGYSEQWGIALREGDNKSPEQRRAGKRIQYADLADLTVIMGMKTGGGVMEAVNRAQQLVKPTR